MKKHRTDYRTMDNYELINESDYGIGVNWKELALVLAERLEARRREYSAFDLEK